jgi:hypothetical protein
MSSTFWREPYLAVNVLSGSMSWEVRFEGSVLSSGLSREQAVLKASALNGAYNLGRMSTLSDPLKEDKNVR